MAACLGQTSTGCLKAEGLRPLLVSPGFALTLLCRPQVGFKAHFLLLGWASLPLSLNTQGQKRKQKCTCLYQEPPPLCYKPNKNLITRRETGSSSSVWNICKYNIYENIYGIYRSTINMYFNNKKQSHTKKKKNDLNLTESITLHLTQKF